MKVPYWKLFLIKKLTAWPRAIIYLLIYLVLGFTYALNTTIDTNWNARLLGTINFLLPNKGIIKIILFILVKITAYFLLVFFLEWLFSKLSKINISSQELLQMIMSKKFSLNGKVYPVSGIFLVKKSIKKAKKVSGKMLVYEEDFEINFSSWISLKELNNLKKEERIKEITWWKAKQSKFLFSIVLAMVIGVCFFVGWSWLF